MTTFSFTLPSTPTPTDLGLTEETDLAGRAVDNALWQYSKMPRFQAFLEALINAVQPAESVGFDVYEGIRLAAAVGTQLDLLGALVGEPRAGKVDDEYRTFIRVKIKVNRSNGKAEEIYGVLALISFDTQRLFDSYPAGYYIEVTETLYPAETFRFMGFMKPAGVGMQFVYSPYDGDNTFQLSRKYITDEYDSATGFGSEYDASTGGRISGVFA